MSWSRITHARAVAALALTLGLGSVLSVLAGCVPPDLSRGSAASRAAPQAPAAAAAVDPGQLPREAPMPLLDEIRGRQLPNGMRYYIRRNQEPAGRAELRFVVDAGSLLEAEDQKGFAHFLEHMLFNGTERFPGMGVLAFLQATGMQLGPDANAYTTHDETVCVIKLPTDNPNILPTAFDVMEDWATAVLLDPGEVEAERGVIVEERRLRSLSAGGRVSQQVFDLYLRGTRYAERPPIGDVEVIRSGSLERLRDFYRTWYRPENLAIVAVGDFDPDRVEALIQERFAGLERPADPAPARPAIDIEASGTEYAVLTDPEQPVTSVAVSWRRPGVEYPTVGGYQKYLEAQLFDRMLSARLLEVAGTGDSPVLQAAAQRGLVVRALEIRTVTALTSEGGAEEALEVLLTEVERVRRHGFTAAELERAKRDVLTTYQRAAAESRNTPSASLADELVRHVTTDEPVPGILAERAYTERFLPAITLEDMAAEARLYGPEDRLVVVISPEKAGLEAPEQAALAAVVERVAGAEIDDYVESLSGEELMAEVPEPAQIRSRREIEELGVTELVLENGARVLYKPTDLREREILFSASSPGGASLVSDEDYPEARLSAAVVAESGVGDYSRTDLIKLLAGVDLTLTPTVGSYFEGLDGQVQTDDLASLLQLVHLYFRSPRRDPAAAARVPRELISRLENLSAVPEAALQEVLEDALYGENVRVGLLPLESIQSLDTDRLFAIYGERFANAGDFTFSFVGSFDPAELEDLVRRYVGTLPSAPERERYVEHLPEPPQEVVSRTLTQGREPRAVVNLVFDGPLPEAPTAVTRFEAQFLEDALGENLDAEMREARGAVYGVRSDVVLSEIPTPRYRATIDFTTDPERVDELLEVVFDEIESVRTRDIPDYALTLYKRTERRKREEALESNGFWLGILDRWAKFPEYDPRRALDFEAQLAAVTPESVRALGERIFRDDRYVKVVLRPESEAGATAD